MSIIVTEKTSLQCRFTDEKLTCKAPNCEGCLIRIRRETDDRLKAVERLEDLWKCWASGDE